MNFFQVNWSENVPMAGLTTLAVGGPARWHAIARDPAEVAGHLQAAADRQIRTLILGGGSNLLVSDRGFDGLVLEVRADRVELRPNGGTHVRMVCQAGAEWDQVVATAVQHDLAGIECLSGIPGRVGAAPIQNIGAYGQEVASVLHAVHVVERHTGRPRELAAQECGFAYRWSRFKGEWHDRFAITSVELKLERGGAPSLRYQDLRRHFPEGAQPGLAEVRRAVLDIRRSKSMVYDPADPNHRSAGSFFLNPVVPPAQVPEGEDVPRYPAPEGKVKLSAAWLIERAGFPKGMTLGKAGLSTNHTLALINRGGASAADLIALAARIRAGVRERFGITLHPEPIFIGFQESADELLG